MHASFCTGALFAVVMLAAPAAQHQRIDFETIPSNTLVRDQFVPLGLRVAGAGAFSGLAISEGQYGTANYRNSPSRFCDIGNRRQATTLTFVDPANSGTVLGAEYVFFIAGDGDPDQETFEVTFFDRSGVPLSGPTSYTTSTDGLVLGASRATLGAPIGSLRLELSSGSQSGATFDDLVFRIHDAAMATGCPVLAGPTLGPLVVTAGPHVFSHGACAATAPATVLVSLPGSPIADLSFLAGTLCMPCRSPLPVLAIPAAGGTVTLVVPPGMPPLVNMLIQVACFDPLRACVRISEATIVSTG